MSNHHLEIRVKPRPGLLDPQGTAVQHALDSLGFSGISDVRIGKVIDVQIEADTESDAIDQVHEMCRKLLANPVTEDFDVAVRAQPGLVEETA